MDFAAMFMKVCTKNGLVFSFMLIGIITLITQTSQVKIPCTP